jgi:hypothetical protein
LYWVPDWSLNSAAAMSALAGGSNPLAPPGGVDIIRRVLDFRRDALTQQDIVLMKLDVLEDVEDLDHFQRLGSVSARYERSSSIGAKTVMDLLQQIWPQPRAVGVRSTY